MRSVKSMIFHCTVFIPHQLPSAPIAESEARVRVAERNGRSSTSSTTSIAGQKIRQSKTFYGGRPLAHRRNQLRPGLEIVSRVRPQIAGQNADHPPSRIHVRYAGCISGAPTLRWCATTCAYCTTRSAPESARTRSAPPPPARTAPRRPPEPPAVPLPRTPPAAAPAPPAPAPGINRRCSRALWGESI